MNYLLDTHTCIWSVSEKEKLSLPVTNIMEDADNNFWVSKISLLEIVIKKKTARIEEFNISFPEFVNSLIFSGYSILDLKDGHLETYAQLDFHETHRDPFDRYLLASARFENFAIITKDEKFQLYKDTFKIVW